ncbi:hypothetical protein [Comamonas terrigena]|uniref:hypothetical protein n=1 Tax=Comamonas terrigena TaxID=32013 RepID=UPI00244D74A7|nr:hypothetical protein [Comamonas terrigena]MDH0051470.1 hypothetical protein [Comamonas terrigena]MDH0513844.1 hypothetical protein [Comamonas terrigena]MDH1093415.1 hypothetical protein [Comamonas terrigena]
MIESQNRVNDLAKQAVQVALQDFGQALCLAHEAGQVASFHGIKTPREFRLLPALVNSFLRGRDEIKMKNNYIVMGCFHCAGKPTILFEKSKIIIECLSHPEIPVRSVLSVNLSDDEDLRDYKSRPKNIEESIFKLIQNWEWGIDVWVGKECNDLDGASRQSHIVEVR